MDKTHVVSALKAKRAEISGYIKDLEKKVARQRATLAHIDATIRVFSPDTDPDAIPPRRRYRRAGYFARNELSRLVQEMLRDASGPMSATEIAVSAMTAKGFATDDANLRTVIVEMALTVLRSLRKRGAVAKTGVSQDARWEQSPT